jgi:hypothetical protein
MMTLICPQCRQSLTVPDGSAGQKTNCPTCGTPVDVPMAPGPEIPPPVARVVAAVPPDQPFVQPASTSGPVREPSSHRAEGRPKPSITESGFELAVNSIILGGLGFLASPAVVLVRPAGVFPVVLLAIAVLALGGLGLFLGIVGLVRALGRQMKDFWYVISGLALSGLAILLGLTMFIAGLMIAS